VRFFLSKNKKMSKTEKEEKVWSEEAMKSFVESEETLKTQLEKVLINLKEKLNSNEDFVMDKNIKFEGLSNKNYLIHNSTNKYFLRVCSKGGGLPWASAQREYDVLKLFQDNNLNISPKVYYIDTSKSLIEHPYSVQEFIEGKVDTISDHKLVAKCLKKLHSINYLDLKGDNSILDVSDQIIWSGEELIPTYGELIRSWMVDLSKEVLEKEESEKLEKIHNEITEKTKDLLSIRTKIPRKNICHRDAHHLNFIKKEDGELMLLDWESVHLNHYTIDLVYYANHLSDEDEKEFLKEYGFEDTKENKLVYFLESMVFK
jgi:aminoglycoside phosphotransferase (APT) family kinase protein